MGTYYGVSMYGYYYRPFMIMGLAGSYYYSYYPYGYNMGYYTGTAYYDLSYSG